MVDMQCPKCGSSDTKRMKLEIFDHSVRKLWLMIVIFAVLGVSIHPVILFFAVVAIILMIAVNAARKHHHKNDWVMQCTRCGHQFSVDNPDKIELVNEKKAKQKEKQNQKVKMYAEKNRVTIEHLNKNGQLLENETLLYTVDYFCPHKSAYTTAGAQLKVTDKSLICYNEKSRLRIPQSSIISIKKKNYFLIIPTGIQICTNDEGRKRKYDFVVMFDKRKEILRMLDSSHEVSFQSQR